MSSQATIEQQELRLPFYFPRSKAKCTDVTKAFFDCFSEKSIKKQKGDTTVGQKALYECRQSFDQYKQCMEN